jgi:hypothetical protein
MSILRGLYEAGFDEIILGPIVLILLGAGALYQVRRGCRSGSPRLAVGHS